MCEDLDKELPGIIDVYCHVVAYYGAVPVIKVPRKAIEKIKQAFIEAGWFNRGDIVLVEDATEHIPVVDNVHSLNVKPPVVYTHAVRVDDKLVLTNGVDTLAVLDMPEVVLMTGQEWYERFNLELPQLKSKYSRSTIDSAAKKAAGIE